MAHASHLGRYEILEVIGQGAMGAVYKARDPMMDRVVAVKTILSTALSGPMAPEYRERFYREARAAGRFSHPNIVTIYDVGEHEETPYLVMEYVPGRTLESVMEGGHRFTLEQTYELGRHLGDALEYAHKHGVIHRDIKPANILLTADGKPKIADFGVAKLTAAQVTTTGQLLGTPAFMAPEQFTGAQIDGRADLFSLGVILYWMATADKPFTGDTIVAVSYKIVHTQAIAPRRLNPSISTEFEAVLQRLLEKDPGARYQTGGELARDLAALSEGRAGDGAYAAAALRAVPPGAPDEDPGRTTPILGTRSPASASTWKDSDISVGPAVRPSATPSPGQSRTAASGPAVASAPAATSAKAGTTIGPGKARRSNAGPLFAVGVAVILALVAGGIFISRRTSQPLPSSSEPQQAAQPTATPPAAPTLPPEAEKAARDGAKMAQDALAAAQKVIANANGLKTPENMSASPSRTVTPPRKGAAAASPAVEISATSPVNMMIRADSQPPSMHQLSPGGSVRLEFKQEMVLQANNAGALRLKLNGKAMPALGAEGKPRTVRITPTGEISDVAAVPGRGGFPVIPKALTILPPGDATHPNRVRLRIEANHIPVMVDLTIWMDNDIIFQREAGTQEGQLSFSEERQLPPGRHRFRVLMSRAGAPLRLERTVRGELRMDQSPTLRIELVNPQLIGKQGAPFLNVSLQ